MKVASIKTNFALNLINTITGVLFPVVTFPYASRILLADGIGQVQFFDSIISYIVLFSSLGIPIYAVRELARCRDNKRERSKLTAEIVTLHSLLTVLGYVGVLVLAMTVTKIQLNLPLFLVLSTSVLISPISVSWFYQAIEDFRYITICSVVVRVVCLVALFLFVHTQQDLLYYGIIHIGGTVGGGIFNFFRLRKYVSLRPLRWGELRIMRHLKPALRLFALNLIISFYTQLDSVMLGFMTSDAVVGYYSSAMKATKIMLTFVAALTAVLMPRSTHLLSTGQTEAFVNLGNRALSITMAMIFPVMAGFILLSEPVVMLLSGGGFAPAVLTLRLLAPVLVFIGINGVVYMQMLLPQGRENIVTISCLIGAVVNVGLNLLLIPRFAQNGAAFASSVAEAIILVAELIIGWRYLSKFRFVSRCNIDYLVGTLIMTAVLLVLMHVVGPLGSLNSLLLYTGVGMIVYMAFLIFRKNELYLYVSNLISEKVYRR